MCKNGLLERVEVHDAPGGIIARYRLTLMGRKRLQSEIRRLEAVAKQARYKLGERPFAA